MDVLESIRPLLPAWTAFTTLAIWVPFACLIGWACAALALRVAFAPYRRLAPDAPWVVRVRHAYPARYATQLVTLLAMLVLSALSTLYAGPSVSIVQDPCIPISTTG